jgi:hypothetical protein
MNARSTLLVALSVLAVSACEPPGPHPPVAVNHVHTPEPSRSPATAAAGTPVPTQQQPPAAAAAAPPGRCHTAGLLVSFAGSEGAAGTIVDTFRMTNIGQSACTLYGFVGMRMLDASGRPLATRVVRNGGIFSTQAGPSRFVLQTAGVATFQAAWSDVPHGSEGVCPPAARLEVTPPDEYDQRVVAVGTWSLAPCAGGEIDVTPIRAAGGGNA